MKKRLFAAVLVLIFALSLLPVSAAAATKPTDADWKTPPIIADLKIDHDEYHVWLEATIETPANVLNAIQYSQEDDNWEEVGYITTMEMKVTIDGKEYEDYLDMNYSEKNPEVSNGDFCGIYETVGLAELHVDSEVRAQVRYCGWDFSGSISESRFSDWSNELVLNEKTDFTASAWALGELTEAAGMGLIPDCLKGADLTKPITRAEFAAVSVKLYEALSGKTAEPAPSDTFSDTTDPEVLKACALGVTNGTDTVKKLFSPDVLISREQTATMLTRVWKLLNLEGWTLETDGSFAEEFRTKFTMPALFADDGDISPWARDSVYFMAANGIVKGMEGNLFAPKIDMSRESATCATREQALLMSVRSAKNL